MGALSERHQWFIDHIGQTVWRNNCCDCIVCKSVYENGLFIGDRMQADYAYDCECDFTTDGNPLRYFETKDERDTYEKSLPK